MTAADCSEKPFFYSNYLLLTVNHFEHTPPRLATERPGDKNGLGEKRTPAGMRPTSRSDRHRQPPRPTRARRCAPHLLATDSRKRNRCTTSPSSLAASPVTSVNRLMRCLIQQEPPMFYRAPCKGVSRNNRNVATIPRFFAIFRRQRLIAVGDIILSI